MLIDRKPSSETLTQGVSAAAGRGVSDTAATAMAPAAITAESRRAPVGRTPPRWNNVMPKTPLMARMVGPANRLDPLMKCDNPFVTGLSACNPPGQGN
ncbi:hypothetical protein Mro02_11630 [Microbispora rosea subsp. aerata]|nr:hypothetical protein Mro02_11630 [Microbispora rosea subsp. aerata]GLJ83560.1 hypothetical protein GCM10017588_22880 [Microbispora rosea subsp. aerata]